MISKLYMMDNCLKESLQVINILKIEAMICQSENYAKLVTDKGKSETWIFKSWQTCLSGNCG